MTKQEVGIGMKRIFIVLRTTLLVLAILTVFACAGEIPGTGHSGNDPKNGYETIYGRLCTEARNAATQHSNWIFFIGTGSETGTGIMQDRRSPAGFTSPSPAWNGNIPGNIRPASNNGQNNQQHPFFERESLKSREMLDREELSRFLENQNQNQNLDLDRNQNFQQEDGAYYQAYVTPDVDAVKNYLEENDLDDKYEIYEAALSWTWVSDEALHGAEEKWLTPAEFLEDTPDYAENPVSGEPVSDCEEQAHALASLLIASGEYNENSVRVAIGEVNFGEASGGHAWVEVYEDSAWFPLDATGGPYYDEESSEVLSDVSEIDYEEYRNSSYPVVEVWYYYNNEYFVDLGTQSGDAPISWQKFPESYQGNTQTRGIQNSRMR
ncbi:MAG: transglutaminase-like domain-containing protein [Methanosarcinaceae archaeon]